jgi:NitT/TauT family transport system permease protein
MTTVPTEPDRFSRSTTAENIGEAPMVRGRRARLRPYRRSLIVLARILIVVGVLAIWWGVGKAGVLNPLTFPGLGDTVSNFMTSLTNGTLVSASLYTLEAAAIGFVIGMAAGTLVGMGIGLSDTLTSIFGPFISVLNTLPRIALAPLYVLWFGIGTESGAALVISLVLFTALLNTISGTRAVDPNHIIIARLYGASRWDVVWKVVLPETVPWIITAARLSLAHALAGAIFSEMFLGQQGLGYLIAQGSGVFNMGVVFAAVFASLVLAVIFEQLAQLIQKRLLRWRPTV